MPRRVAERHIAPQRPWPARPHLTMSPGRKQSYSTTLSISVARTSCCLHARAQTTPALVPRAGDARTAPTACATAARGGAPDDASELPSERLRAHAHDEASCRCRLHPRHLHAPQTHGCRVCHRVRAASPLAPGGQSLCRLRAHGADLDGDHVAGLRHAQRRAGGRHFDHLVLPLRRESTRCGAGGTCCTARYASGVPLERTCGALRDAAAGSDCAARWSSVGAASGSSAAVRARTSW